MGEIRNKKRGVIEQVLKNKEGGGRGYHECVCLCFSSCSQIDSNNCRHMSDTELAGPVDPQRGVTEVLQC